MLNARSSQEAIETYPCRFNWSHPEPFISPRLVSHGLHMSEFAWKCDTSHLVVLSLWQPRQKSTYRVYMQAAADVLVEAASNIACRNLASVIDYT